MNEFIYTNEKEVACNGGTLGHPKIYLNIKNSGQVVCPYCSKTFIYQEKVYGDSK